MNNHCSNGRPQEQAEPRTSQPSADCVPVPSFTCTLEGRLLPSGEYVPLSDAVSYDAFGNGLDACDFQPYELDEEALLHGSSRACDPTPGSWMQEDAIRFAAGDANLARYVHGKASESSVQSSA